MSRVRNYRGILLTLFFAAFVTFLLVDTFELSKIAGWIPRLVLSITLLLLLIQLFLDVRRRVYGPAPDTAPNPGPEIASMGPAVAWITALAPLLWLFGISVGAAIFCLGFMRWNAGESWRFSTAFAVGLGFTLQIIFTHVLQLTLYSGVLLRTL